jgi:hypothetical protein
VTTNVEIINNEHDANNEKKKKKKKVMAAGRSVKERNTE